MHFAFCISCSVPKLESAECGEAREAVRAFYSFHFAGDLQYTPENLKARERFLSDELKKSLPPAPTGGDPFTLTEDPPRAFRVGGCEVVEPGRKVSFGVLVFWKTDTRADQREIRVEAAKDAGGKWLVNKISN